MKSPIIAAVVVALVGATSLAFGAPGTFEGKVTYELTTNHGPVSMIYYVKDHLARTEISMVNGRSVVVLLNFNTHKMTILMPEQKMYMVHSLPTAAPRSSGDESAAPPAVDFKRTGQFKTILGRKCEKIVVKSRGEVTDVWGAEGMGVFMYPGMRGPMGWRGRGPRNAWESELRQRGFFPLRVVTHDADGRQLSSMEAKKIDPSPLSDSLFAPPADYRKFEIPAMPGMHGMNPFKH